MKWIKPLANIVVPALLFYVIYHAAGITPAITISLAYSILSAVYSKIKGSTVKNSQIIGILGLLGSAAAVIFSGNEKLYYLPAAIQNALFLGFIIVLSARRKSVLHYIAKDFEIRALEEIPEASMFSINVLWIIYFLIKLTSKIVGILYWDFNRLYWVVFLLGDPMAILVIILSIVLIRLHFGKGRNTNDKHDPER